MGARFQLKRLGAGESFSCCGESVATDFVSSLSLLFVCLFVSQRQTQYNLKGETTTTTTTLIADCVTSSLLSAYNRGE